MNQIVVYLFCFKFGILLLDFFDIKDIKLLDDVFEDKVF